MTSHDFHTAELNSWMRANISLTNAGVIWPPQTSPPSPYAPEVERYLAGGIQTRISKSLVRSGPRSQLRLDALPRSERVATEIVLLFACESVWHRVGCSRTPPIALKIVVSETGWFCEGNVGDWPDEISQPFPVDHLTHVNLSRGRSLAYP